ncbi:CIC11C00000004402 [Sungouiella intermedia]|uniref:CIC11C00000004402 n=1 Tax=Sungouiella intermedia TaxID=45354 RepID=A0A1L0DXX2_9ASCO|nr:CIC11C00000004402 [[Candida] intermedia]
MSSKHKSEEFVYDSESGSDFEDVGFEAPKHFEKVPLLTPKTKIGNSEVWLIKAPKGFPVSKLKSLPVSFTSSKVSDKGVKPFDLEGKSFQVNEETFASDSAKYTIIHESLLNKKIDRYYTVRQVVEIPEINYSRAIQARTDVPKEENLRMRHFPTGYSASNYIEAQPIPESRLDEDGKVIKKMRIEPASEKKEKKDKKEKKEKKDKKDKKKDKKKKKD